MPEIADVWKEEHGTTKGLPPKTPAAPTLTFDTTERHHHQKWRCKTQITEIHTDVLDQPLNGREVKHYDWKFQKSQDGVDASETARWHTSGAKDEDANNVVHHIWHNIRKYRHYRAAVRAVLDDGAVGDYSAWSSWTTPAEDIPPAPINVTIYEKSTNRVVGDWDAPDNPDDADLITERVAHFQVAIMQDTTAAPTSGTWYRADRYAHHTRHSFRIKDVDKGSTFYIWVRSVDGDGDKSAWIPATIAGNDSAGATPDGVIVGSGGKARHTFSITGVIVSLAETEIHDLDIDEPMTLIKARCRVKQTINGAAITITPYKNNTNALSTLVLASGDRRDVNDSYNVAFASGDSLSFKVDVGGGASQNAKHLTIIFVFDTT